MNVLVNPYLKSASTRSSTFTGDAPHSQAMRG